jgi:Zn-dependent M28 family amino/carboxypeptidase
MNPRRIQFSAALFGILMGVLPAALASAEGMAAADQVSLESYYQLMNEYLYTHSGMSRSAMSGAQHDAARDSILALFQSYGLSAHLETFSSYYSGENVVAEKLGTLYPDQIFVFGAHYDSGNNPGADDDASGVAGLLEAARVLSNYTFENTLVFAAFDREEQGLRGSAAWAAAHSSATITGMLELDMIAYNPGGANTAGTYTVSGTANAASIALANSITNYSGGLTVAYLRATNRSDHASFDSRGPSALLIETYWQGNPYYHKATDSLDTAGYIDYTYATLMTRSGVGWMMLEAGDEVPEPAALWLAGSGLLLLVVRRWSAGKGVGGAFGG